MKTNFKIFTVFLIMMTSCLTYPRQAYAQQSNVSFQVFYDQLSPYGQWIDDRDYGYVWIPDAGSNFVPYSTNGHWILTDYGWTWDSDYSWGWAPFHYGRWSFDDSFGWFWVPDNEWGPAWVNWREADGYYGWSPMEPGMTLSMSFSQNYTSSHNQWMFVRNSDFERTDINHYYINHADQDRIARNSTVINFTYVDNNRHTTYASGPSRSQVQRVTGRTITPVIIQENNKPGKEISNGQLRIYRPQIVKGNNTNQKPMPTRISNVNDVKRRNSSNQQQNSNPVNDNHPVIQSNAIAPQNNSKPGVIQQNNNQQDQQKRNSFQPNPNNPVQPQNPGINHPVRQPEISNQNNNVQYPQNRVEKKQPDNNTQPVQQPTVSPQNSNIQRNNNSQQVQQQRNVTPQNNNPQQVQQQRNVTPQNNNSQPVQPPIVNQQNQNKQVQTAPSNVQNKPLNNQPPNQNKQVRKGNKQPIPPKQPIKPKEDKPEADKKVN